MIIEQDNLRIEEFRTMPDGRKWYEIREKRDHFSAISFLTNIAPAQQTESELLRLAKARFNAA